MVHKHAWTSLKKCSRFFGHQSIGQATPKLGSSASPWVQNWKVPRTTQFWPRSPCISPMLQPQKLHFWRSTSTSSSRNIQGISKQKRSDSLSCLPHQTTSLTQINFFWGGGPLNKSLPQPFFQLRCRLILRTSRLMPATTGPTSTSTMRGNVVPMNTRVPMLWADFCCLVELMRSWGIQMGQGLEMIVVFLGFSLFFFGHLDSEVTRICSFRMDIYDYLCVCWSFWNIISACKY